MATHSSITQICKVPPKRLIHLVIFILISLKCYQTEEPFKKRCWVSRQNFRYLGLVGILSIQQLEECKDHCQHVVTNCDMIAFDVLSKTIKCAFKNTSAPIEASKIESKDQVVLYFLDLDCARNVPSCWTTKGDHDFRGLERFDKKDVTVEECKQLCLNATPACDVITYAPYASGGPKCFTRTQAGQLNQFFVQRGTITYVLDKTCHKGPETATVKPPQGDSKVGESSSGKMVIIIVGVLLLIVVLAGALFFGSLVSKKSKATEETPAPPGAAGPLKAPKARKAKVDFEEISISSK